MKERREDIRGATWGCSCTMTPRQQSVELADEMLELDTPTFENEVHTQSNVAYQFPFTPARSLIILKLSLFYYVTISISTQPVVQQNPLNRIPRHLDLPITLKSIRSTRRNMRTRLQHLRCMRNQFRHRHFHLAVLPVRRCHGDATG